jgi:calcineurin-like phosphoesterase
LVLNILSELTRARVRSGRATVKELLPSLRSEHAIDLVIANGENVTHGKGINEAHYKEILSYG